MALGERAETPVKDSRIQKGARAETKLERSAGGSKHLRVDVQGEKMKTKGSSY